MKEMGNWVTWWDWPEYNISILCFLFTYNYIKLLKCFRRHTFEYQLFLSNRKLADWFPGGSEICVFTMKLSTCMGSWQLAGMYNHHKSPGSFSSGEPLMFSISLRDISPEGRTIITHYCFGLSMKFIYEEIDCGVFASCSSGHITLSRAQRRFLFSCSAVLHVLTAWNSA